MAQFSVITGGSELSDYTQAEYARERDMLAVMPRMQALSLPKELIGHTLMIDSLHELIEVLKIK